MTNLLIVLKSVDGGTGTYLEGLLALKKLYAKKELTVTVAGLEKPTYRKIHVTNYHYFSNHSYLPSKYKISLKNGLNFYREIRWLKQIVLDSNPTIVISQDAHAILLTEITKLLFKFRFTTISAIHNNIFKVFGLRLPQNFENFFRLVFGFFLKKSKIVISVSKQLSNDLKSVFDLRQSPETISCVLPKRVLSQFPSNTEKTGNVVISVARMDKQKDYQTLLRAFAKVIKVIPQARLWLVGDGPDKQMLQKMTISLGIDKETTFFGWEQHPEKLMDKASLFVLSSNWEGLPLSMIEAMNRGLPVLATDCQYGPNEIIGSHDEYGLLVPMKDFHSMARKMTSILLDRKAMSRYERLSLQRSKDYLGDSSLMMYKKLIDICQSH